MNHARVRKMSLSVVLVALFSVLVVHEAGAETTVQLGSNRVGITVYSLDDHITCTLNGTVVLKMDFGDTGSEDVTRHLVPGANKLKCVVTDDDLGFCFAYGYRVWTRLDQGAQAVVHSSNGTCCDGTCARPGNPVADETVWVVKP